MATGGGKEGKCRQIEGVVVLSQCLFLYTSALLRHEATVILVTIAQSIKMMCATLLLDSYKRKTEHVLHMHPKNLHGARGMIISLGGGVWEVTSTPQKRVGAVGGGTGARNAFSENLKIATVRTNGRQ